MQSNACVLSGYSVADFGQLLKWGSMGLALAVVIFLGVLLLGIQKQAANPNGGGAALAPMEKMVKLMMSVVIVLFSIATLASPVIDHFFGPRSGQYQVSFNLDPSELPNGMNELVPTVVVSGSGAVVELKNGTGQDTVAADRHYRFSFNHLVQKVSYLQTVVNAQQQATMEAANHGQ